MKDNLIRNYVPDMLYDDLSEIANREMWKSKAGKTFLITGGTGFIAYYLCLSILVRNDLYDDGNTVILLVRNEEKAKKRYGGLLERKDVRLLIQDVCEQITMPQCDYIIHAAGGAESRLFETCPVDVFNANTLGTQQILHFAHCVNAESVVYVSSFTVYGRDSENQERVSEDFVGNLDWKKYNLCYANAKRGGEMLCNCYLHQFHVPVKIVRPGFIYGASSLDDSRVYAEIIRNVYEKKDITLKSAGLVYRSMCYVTDLVRGMLHVLFYGNDGEAYNVASEHLSIRQFAQHGIEAFPERKLALRFEHEQDENVQIPDKVFGEMDCAKLSQISPYWTPKVSVENGIKMAVEIWERKKEQEQSPY